MITIGDPCYLLDLAWKAKEMAEELVAVKYEPDLGQQQDSPPIWLSMTRIDHMRDQRRYLKILTGWSEELGLSGRLLMPPSSSARGILMLLAGEKEDLDRCE